MCLYYSEIVTKDVLKRLKRRGKIRAWKSLRPTHVWRYRKAPLTRLESDLFGHVWKPGWNRSNRPHNTRAVSRGGKFESFEMVNTGIHVFLKKPVSACAVPVTCRKEDFVAGGRQSGLDQAVFTKVHLSEAAYKAAMKRLG